jgi:hypothetical protein
MIKRALLVKAPLGPVSAALVGRANLDFRFVTETVTESDDWGQAAAAPPQAFIDLGAGIP